MTETTNTTESAVLGALQEMLQGKYSSPINGSDVPIGDLGLDSEDEIEFICLIEEKLGFEIDARHRPLADEANGRGRTVDETIAFVNQLVSQAGESSNE